MFTSILNPVLHPVSYCFSFFVETNRFHNSLDTNPCHLCDFATNFIHKSFCCEVSDTITNPFYPVCQDYMQTICFHFFIQSYSSIGDVLGSLRNFFNCAQDENFDLLYSSYIEEILTKIDKCLSSNLHSIMHSIDSTFSPVFHRFKTFFNLFANLHGFLNDCISKIVKFHSSISDCILSFFVDISCKLSKGNEVFIKFANLFNGFLSKITNIFHCTLNPLTNITKHILKFADNMFTKFSHSFKDV